MHLIAKPCWTWAALSAVVAAVQTDLASIRPCQTDGVLISWLPLRPAADKCPLGVRRGWSCWPADTPGQRWWPRRDLYWEEPDLSLPREIPDIVGLVRWMGSLLWIEWGRLKTRSENRLKEVQKQCGNARAERWGFFSLERGTYFCFRRSTLSPFTNLRGCSTAEVLARPLMSLWPDLSYFLGQTSHIASPSVSAES